METIQSNAAHAFTVVTNGERWEDMAGERDKSGNLTIHAVEILPPNHSKVVSDPNARLWEYLPLHLRTAAPTLPKINSGSFPVVVELPPDTTREEIERMEAWFREKYSTPRPYNDPHVQKIVKMANDPNRLPWWKRLLPPW